MKITFNKAKPKTAESDSDSTYMRRISEVLMRNGDQIEKVASRLSDINSTLKEIKSAMGK